MKTRKSRSAIINIRDTSGVWIDDATGVRQLFVDDFKLCFKSSSSPSLMINLPPKISSEDNMALIKPVEDDEIKEAVFQMDKFKAPDPDGFGAAFF